MKILIISKSFVLKSALEIYFKDNFNIESVICCSKLSDLKKINLFELDVIFIEMHESISFEDIIKIKNYSNNIKFIIYDDDCDMEHLHKAINNNIEGYITNLDDKDEFNIIIKKIFNGEKYYDINLLLKYIMFFNKINNNTTFKDSLTLREKDILRFVSYGYTNKDIATNLVLSENTIKRHISNILRKLNLNNRKELILYYKDNIAL